MKKKSKSLDVGDKIVLTESVVVYDDLGHDLLISGTEGNVTEMHGKLLTLRTKKGMYYGIPAKSAKLKKEDNAA